MKESGAVKGQNIFVPISLGNHYYSVPVLRRVIDNYIRPSSLSIILICDRLRFLSYLIRGEIDKELIRRNIKIQMHEFSKVVDKLGAKSCPSLKIADWSFCEQDVRYRQLLSKLYKFVKGDSTVRREMDEHVNRLAKVRDWTDRSSELQVDYIIEETAVSLYMTEIRQYNVEVYRRGLGFIDYLYQDRNSELQALTGNSVLRRKFISLEDSD